MSDVALGIGPPPLGLAPPPLSSGMQGAESPFTLGLKHGNALGNARSAGWGQAASVSEHVLVLRWPDRSEPYIPGWLIDRFIRVICRGEGDTGDSVSGGGVRCVLARVIHSSRVLRKVLQVALSRDDASCLVSELGEAGVEVMSWLGVSEQEVTLWLGVSQQEVMSWLGVLQQEVMSWLGVAECWSV